MPLVVAAPSTGTPIRRRALEGCAPPSPSGIIRRNDGYRPANRRRRAHPLPIPAPLSWEYGPVRARYRSSAGAEPVIQIPATCRELHGSIKPWNASCLVRIHTRRPAGCARSPVRPFPQEIVPVMVLALPPRLRTLRQRIPPVLENLQFRRYWLSQIVSM